MASIYPSPLRQAFCIIAERYHNIVAYENLLLGVIGWSRRNSGTRTEEATMKHFSIFLAALLATAVTLSPALAAEPAAGIAIVNTADLDLGNARDVRALDRRLTIAIVEACGEASNVDLAGRNIVRACRVDARAKVDATRNRLVQLAARGSATKFASAH
jgi:UrcA family protein